MKSKENRELIERLETEGARQNSIDLSNKTVSVTRRRVAYILAEKQKSKADYNVLLGWFNLSNQGLKTVAAIIPIALIAIILVVRNKERPTPPTSAELAMQQEIEELSSKLRGGLSHFHNKLGKQSRISSLNTKRANLRAKIDRCYVEIQKELAEGKVETAENKNFMSISEEMESMPIKMPTHTFRQNYLLAYMHPLGV